MDFDLLPVDEIMQVLRTESDPEVAFNKILGLADRSMPSQIWKEYEQVDISRDITEATNWIQDCLNQYPKSTGIYLGLDTLNMEEGTGTNVEIGLSKSCNPALLSSDWMYECENYAKAHLIRGLYEVSGSFEEEDKWSDEEREVAEYVVFLGYSGVVLKQALNQLKTSNNFLSVWGFHDGDMFFLTQKLGGLKVIMQEVES